MAKKFMYVCFGIMALMISLHFGATPATSLQTGGFVSIMKSESPGYFLALQEDGSVYWARDTGYHPSDAPFPDWNYWGQIPSGGTALDPSTWGSIKADWREDE